MKKQLLSLLFITMAGTAQSQVITAPKDSLAPKCAAWSENHYIDISMGTGDQVFISSLQWDKLFSVTRNKRLKIGFGFRTNIASGWNVKYGTPYPDRVSTDLLDTLVMDRQTLFSTNLTFCIEGAVAQWMDIGFNIDVAGFSWGEMADGTYYSQASDPKITRQRARPETFNLLLFGINDKGSLNSQLYLRFWPAQNFYIKGAIGILHLQNHSEAPLYYSSTFMSGHIIGSFGMGFCPSRSVIVKKRKFRKTITPAF